MASVLDHLLTLAGQAVANYAGRLRATRERRSQQLLAACDMLTELTGLHLKAIDEVVQPIVDRRDLLETLRRYRRLVNNDDLPRGYGEARGVLEAALKLKQFRGGTTEDNPLKVVLVRLAEFQQAAFLLELSSWSVADTLEDVEELWLSLPDDPGLLATGRVRELQKKVSTSLEPMVEWLRRAYPDADLALPSALESREAVIEATRTWCKGWQRHVQTTLYGGRGLNYAVGALRIAC